MGYNLLMQEAQSPELEKILNNFWIDAAFDSTTHREYILDRDGQPILDNYGQPIQIEHGKAQVGHHRDLAQHLRAPEGYPDEELRNVEFMHFDSRSPEQKQKEKESGPQTPYVIVITGWWGRGPEVEDELKALAIAMGEEGLLGDAVSLPGHGQTSNLENGWGNKDDFETAARAILEHIREVKAREPNRPILLHAWSMGGVTALKLVAMLEKMRQEAQTDEQENTEPLVGGVILVDTPAFRFNLREFARRFFGYATPMGQRGIKKEPPLLLTAALKGLSIFFDRIRDRNKPEGMSLPVLLGSAQALSMQDLGKDGTLELVAASQVQILLLSGTNDHVIPKAMIHKLYDKIRNAGGNIIHEIIAGAGHSLEGERPRTVGKVIRNWMVNNKLLRQNKKQAA